MSSFRCDSSLHTQLTGWQWIKVDFGDFWKALDCRLLGLLKDLQVQFLLTVLMILGTVLSAFELLVLGEFWRVFKAGCVLVWG